MKICWFLFGAVLSAVKVLTLLWTVNRIHPNAPYQAVVWAMGGAIMRWLLVTSLLLSALQQGIVSALFAFAGLWLARWGVIVWLERNDWIIKGE
jgi:FtsH-binding integral membrane protein